MKGFTFAQMFALAVLVISTPVRAEITVGLVQQGAAEGGPSIESSMSFYLTGLAEGYRLGMMTYGRMSLEEEGGPLSGPEKSALYKAFDECAPLDRKELLKATSAAVTNGIVPRDRAAVAWIATLLNESCSEWRVTYDALLD